MSKQILRKNTKAFYTALFAKLIKNPWNIFLYVQMVQYINLVIMFLDKLISLKDIGSLQRLGWYLLKYDKYRELVLGLKYSGFYWEILL